MLKKQAGEDGKLREKYMDMKRRVRDLGLESSSIGKEGIGCRI